MLKVLELAWQCVHGPTFVAGVKRYIEYESFNSDPVIGGFYYSDHLTGFEAMLCHEIAHAVQYYRHSVEETVCKPPGATFKYFYSELRNTFINPFLEDQSMLEKQLRS